MKKKLTMVSVHHKGATHTGFVWLSPEDTVTEDKMMKIIKHIIPRGSTFIPGG